MGSYTMEHELSPKLSSFLASWHTTSGNYQRRQGRVFALSFEDFIGLWSKKQIAKLEGWLANGSLYVRLNQDNPYAYVLSWTSYAESQSRVMHKGNACICVRMKSFETCSMGKGDIHTEAAKALISAAMIGVPKSEGHKAKIGKKMKGKNLGRVMSPEEKAARSQSMKDAHARKRQAADI